MSRDDVTVTPEEMAQAIENAQTAVFRDPPWSPNARAFLALLSDRDALRAELERTKGELENMAHAVRFLAKQEARTFEIRGMAIQMLAKGRVEETTDLVMMKWPIVQGLKNQIDLATVGNQVCDYKRVRPAIELLLRAALERKDEA